MYQVYSLKWMSYDLICHAYYSLDPPEGKSLSVQSPLSRLNLRLKLPKDILGRVWRFIPRTNNERSLVGSENFDDNTFKMLIT